MREPSSRSEHQPSAVSERPIGTRTFADAGGTVWRVSECDAGHLLYARGPRVLRFESERGWRLVWRYPADWQRLGDRALEALSHTR